MDKNQSPIRYKPLRQAGESLYCQLQDVVFDKIFSWFVVTAILWAVVASEWIRYWRQTDPSPMQYTIIALLGTIFAAVRTYAHLRHAKVLKLGLQGEKAVGEFLNRFQAKGYRVYHDIPGDKGNIDHVIISKRGIFTIETKTRSLPKKRKAVVSYDGSSVSFAGRAPDDKPIRQARAQASQLKRILKEETGHDFRVKSVVVIPGWFVEPRPGSKQSDVWVLNPKALPKWIDYEPEVIPVDRVKLAATKLGKFIRNA